MRNSSVPGQEAPASVAPAGEETPARRGRGTRPRRDRLEVWVTPEEKAEICRRAEAAGLPGSTFLRNLALNVPIRSVYDYEAVRDMAKIRGDVGRVGGLLKLWLSTKRGEGASVADVNRALRDLNELKDGLLKIMERV